MKYSVAKLLWAALAAVLVAAPMAGCNHDDDDDDTPTNPGGGPPPPPPPPPPGGPGVIELVQADPAGYPESAGNATLTVRRSGGSTGRASIEWEIHTAPGGASPSDFTGTRGFVEWLDGEQGDKPITIPLNDDSTPEGNETFMLFIGSNRGAPIQNADGTTVTIVDDDSGPSGAFQFSQSAIWWDERGGTLRLTVTRSGGGVAPASVSARLQDQTTDPTDYTFASPQVLDFPDGMTTATIDIPIVNDTLREGGESFQLFLENPSPGAFVGTQGSMAVNIVDNDHPGVLTFTQAKWEVFEDSVSVTLSVQRTGGSMGAVSVSFAPTDITATGGTDYALNPGTLTWNDWDTLDKFITVTVMNDAQSEGRETFLVTLSNPTGTAELGPQATSQVDILD